MIVSFPMYDRPEIALANDALWSAVRNRLGYGPETLNRDIGLWDAWEHPDLLLSQTCGMPYRAHLHDRVMLVGSPDYGLPGCPPGYYNSVLVTRSDNRLALEDLFAQRIVINQRHSQSGHAALIHHARTLGVPVGDVSESGSHVRSACMVARDEADLTAIDAHTWRLIQRYDDIARDLRECDRTVPTPAMPFITAPGTDPAPLRAALSGAISNLAPDIRATLNLHAVINVPHDAYMAVPNP